MSESLDKMRDEIDNLQVKLAYQEDTIEQLNHIVTEQQTQIQNLQILSKKMLDKLKSVQTTQEGINDGHELPPHY